MNQGSLALQRSILYSSMLVGEVVGGFLIAQLAYLTCSEVGACRFLYALTDFNQGPIYLFEDPFERFTE